MTTVEPAIGDTNFLKNYLISTRVYGVVVPPGASPEFLATYEIQGDQGTLIIAVAIGPDGPAGANMFALELQNDEIDSAAELPQTLQNSSADIGKYWVIDDVDTNGDIIGSSLYLWYGTTWRRLMLGSPGPPGPVPIITPTVELISPNAVSTVQINNDNPWEPQMDFQLAVPAGPQGPAAALALCPDVDLTTNPPEPFDVMGFTGEYKGGLLSPPSGLLTFAVPSGGTLAAGHYYYVITATNANGETTPSGEASVTVVNGSSVQLVWQAAGSGSFGPTHYKVYRGTTSGGENALIATLGPTTYTYTDTGSAGTAATPPATDSATIQLPVWVPVSISQLMPAPYSMPEGSFTSFSGISSAAAIGSFAIPPQPFPWTPIVWGHIGAFGIELSINPLLIGCEVLLGDPSAGTQIGRGFGNALGEVNIMPHYSTPSTPANAITPTNSRAVVPANHSNPAEGTIYVNLYNDGEIGLYFFQPTDAQIFIMLTPVTE